MPVNKRLQSLVVEGVVLSEGEAVIVGAIIGAVCAGAFGLGGVWLGYRFSRLAAREDRHAEKLASVYFHVERLHNLLTACQTEKLTLQQFYPLWADTTEEIMRGLMGSGLDRRSMTRILTAINAKWDDTEGVRPLRIIADELLEKIDPDYARAAEQLLDNLRVRREEIEPDIVPRSKK